MSDYSVNRKWLENHAPVHILCCQTCEKVLGFVYDCDLEGSLFYCTECGVTLCKIQDKRIPTENA